MYKMSIGYYQKNKETLHRKARVCYKIFLKKMKTKNENMVVNDIKIFLKKTKTKSINILVNNIQKNYIIKIELFISWICPSNIKNSKV